MGKLLCFELRKLFRQVSFYVCLAVLGAVVFLGIFSTYSMIRLMKADIGLEIDMEMLESFGLGLHLNGRGYLLSALNGNNLTLLLGIFFALFICSDYVNGTAKNVIGRGFSRMKSTAAKQIVTAAGTLVFCLAACGLAFVLASAYWGVGKDWELLDLYRFLIQLLVILAYAAFFSFFAFLFKKSGAAIAFNIIAPSLLSLILTLIDIFTEKKKIYFSEYWLADCLTVSTDLSAKAAELTRSGIIAGVYLVVFVLLTHLVTARRDV